MHTRNSSLKFCSAALAAMLAGSVASADPDCVVGNISGIGEYGVSGSLSAYAIGTTACNFGTTLLAWIDSGAQSWRHPVIAQNIFRYKNGRFEQLGQSWVKHGFCAADSTVCGSCSAAGGCDFLGLGCSDTYSWGLNGSQSSLGPRSAVNASTGAFPFPHATPSGNATLAGRIVVATADIDPGQNAGAVFYGEAEYIHPDDANFVTTNTNNNNYRKIQFPTSQSGGQWLLEFNGPQHVGEPAIFAWQDEDPQVQLVTIDTGEGRFWVGSRATDNGDGTWHYEYAVQNLNSDRAAGKFSVPMPTNATVTGIGFHDVDYHSGEPYDNTDWTGAQEPSRVRWVSPQTFAVNPNSNAIRWATMYNFWFDCNVAPVQAKATLSSFKTGHDYEETMTVPGELPCAADFDGDGDADGIDIGLFLQAYGTGDLAADMDGDGDLDGIDVGLFLQAYGTGC